MKKTTIFKALVATLVLSFATSINANAQFGKNLLNKAKEAGKEMLQGNNGSSQQQSSQQQKPAQQPQQTTPQQNNNQTAQPSQPTTQTQQKQSKPAPEKPKEYTRADFDAENALLVGKIDSTSSVTDMVRVYMYLYHKLDKAIDSKNYDFLCDTFSYYNTVWHLIDDIGVVDLGFGPLDTRYLAEDRPKEITPYMEFTTVKSLHKTDAHPITLQGKATSCIKAVPYGQNADQDISAYIDLMLKKAETCKSDNAKGRFLQYILTDRNFYTVKNCRAYPTDESLHTERLRAFMATIPQEIIDKWHCPPLYTAEEIRNQRLEFIKSGLKKHAKIPTSRDAALEAKFKKEILAQRPEAKIKMVVFESDAIADWLVKKNEFSTPTRRIKKGWALIEVPGHPDFVGVAFLESEQKYLGGGKYGTSSVSCDIPPINDKMIFTENWHYCKL